MKIGILLLFAISVFAKNNEVDKTELKEVTLYRNSAEMYNEGFLNLKAGINDYYIVGLAKNINENTILFSSENAQLYSIDYINSYDITDFDKLEKLKDSLNNATKSIEFLEVDSKTIAAQIDYYLNFSKTIPSDKVKYSPLEIGQYQNLLAKQLESLQKERIANQEKMKKAIEAKNEIEKRLNDYQSNCKVSAIKVTLKSDKAQKSKYILDYISPNAGWYITYDMSIAKVGDKANLASKANIFQLTGIDWKNIKLTISDANQIDASKPILYPWELSMGYGRTLDSPLLPKMESSASKIATLEYIHTDNIEVTKEESYTNKSYTIPDLVSIEKDTRSKIIKFNNDEIKVDLYFYAAPKLASNVFLVAKILNSKSLNLMPAEVTTYLEGVYRGKVFIDLDNSDSPEVSFGIVDDVKVERKRISEFTEDKFLSSNKVRNYKYNFKISNNKNEKINFVLMENMPLPMSDDFKLELVKLSDAIKDKNNILTWKFELEAGKSVEKVLEYNLTYPGNYRIRD